jgi:flagellar protein FlaG
MDISAINQISQNTNNYNTNAIDYTQNIQNNNITESSDTGNQDLANNSKNEAISPETAKKATDKINKLLEDTQTHIEYDQDKNFKQVMVMKVIDNNTHQVVNQIPSKQILDMIAQFCEMAGLILNKKA